MRTEHLSHTTCILNDALIVISGCGNETCELLEFAEAWMNSKWKEFDPVLQTRYWATATALN